jgi:hypothetical protein
MYQASKKEGDSFSNGEKVELYDLRNLTMTQNLICHKISFELVAAFVFVVIKIAPCLAFSP